jgi:hypothetical protein
MSDEDRKHAQVVSIWKAAIEVQQHFNDVSMRIRSMFVTILLALFASIGFMLDKKYDLQMGALKIQFAVLIPLIGLLGTYLFYFIDRYWYHRLLSGAVKHAQSIEEMHKRTLPELALSSAIGAESPVTPSGITRALAWAVVRDQKYRETGKLHSNGKMELFYKSVMALLILVTVMLGALGGVTWGEGTTIAPPAVTGAPQKLPPSATSPAGTTHPVPVKEKGK